MEVLRHLLTQAHGLQSSSILGTSVSEPSAPDGPYSRLLHSEDIVESQEDELQEDEQIENITKPLRIAAVFIILLGGLAGTLPPLFSRVSQIRSSKLHMNSHAMWSQN